VGRRKIAPGAGRVGLLGLAQGMQKLHEPLLLLGAETQGSNLCMMWRIRVSSAIVVIDHSLKIRIAAVMEIGRTLGDIPERRNFEPTVV
jgi:hypothetical protein